MRLNLKKKSLTRALSFLFTFIGPGPRSFFMQGSLGELMADDGSDENYPQNLASAFAEVEGDILWVGTGNFLAERSELEHYLATVKPSWVIPHHWDPLSPNLRTGLMRSFAGQDWYEDALQEAGAKLIAPQQYFDEFIMDNDGVRRLEYSAVRESAGFLTE